MSTKDQTRRWAQLFLCAALVAASSSSIVAKDATLTYLSPGKPEVNLLPPPPAPGSAEDAADMATVVAVFKGCSSNEAAVAFSEKKFSVFKFTPAVGEFFQPDRFPKTQSFFERVQKDAAAATDKAKESWKRPRPFMVDASLASGKLEKSFSYPSGHSTEATVLGLVLAELFPDKREEILAISRNIGWHRVEIARHYPTDIYAGRVFARAIVQELKASEAFRNDFAEAKRELTAAIASQTARVEPAPAVAH